MKRWAWIHKRSWLWAPLGVVVAVGAVVSAVLVSNDDGEPAAPAPTTTQPTVTATATATVTTTATTTRTVTNTITAPPTTTRKTITSPPHATTKPPAVVPGQVVATASEGAGSGEVELRWNAVGRATGYRVYRCDVSGGTLRLVADFSITTGRVNIAAPEVTLIYSSRHRYLPGDGLLTTPDTSPSFLYIDIGGPGERNYRVQAYSTAGPGPLSAVTGAGPP